MQKTFQSTVFSLMLSALTFAVVIPAISLAQVKIAATQQLSAGLNGAAPIGTSGSSVIAANGQFLVFRSDASNLLAADSDNTSDIYIRDLTKGTLGLISVNSSGLKGDGNSSEPAISPIGPDGFFAVSFTSFAENLGSVSDAAGFGDVFVRFPTLQRTLSLTLASGGANSDGDSGESSATLTPAPNKLLVAFSSEASNLVSNDLNHHRDIFLATVTPPSGSVQDPNLLVTRKLISTGQNGFQANQDSSEPQISADGRFIIYSSDASNLVTGRSTSGRQIFLYDIAADKTTLISQTSAGVQGNSDSFKPVLSYSGRYVLYLTDATNLFSGAVVNRTALVMLDRSTGIVTRVNSDSSGVAGNGSASDPAISPNGRFATFADTSDNLLGTGGDTDGLRDVFIKDLSSGAIALASRPESGVADGSSDTSCTAGVSYNFLAGFISFRSLASNLSNAPTGGGGEVFLQGATFATPALTKRTKLETPADVVSGHRQSKVTVQQFTLSTAAAATKDIELFAKAAAKKVIRYDIRIEGTGARKKDRFQVISSRNSITKRNLKPGVYTTRYRATTQQGSKTVTATPFSPRMRFQVS